MDGMQGFLRGIVVAAALALGAGTAEAHPHIWIDAKARISFNEAGELVAIHNSWTFDAAFSVWQTQGLDTNGDGITSSEEMQELADENVRGLADYGFYTLVGEGDESVRLASMDNGRFVYEDGRSTLEFGVEPQGPYRIQGRLEVAIADPEFYVAINFAGLSDVTLENAPAGCTLGMDPPRELSPELQERLGQLSADVTTLPDDLAAAVRGAQGAIIIDCTNAAAVAPPATALEAVTQVAEAKPATPFGGPPQEPGFKISPSGPLGWLVVWQEQFYRSLTAALGQLKDDWTAFWVLGSLSFLYGVFHAAGPGHGKVVIGSYMLANERQMRRGIALSFASGLLQAVVAVAVVGVIAAILQLSTSAMDLAVVWIERAAYGLMALLGVWLVARKLFGWGHRHDEPLVATPQPKAGKSHALLAERGQAFQFRTAAATAGAPGGLDAHGRSPGHAHYGHDHGDDDHHHHHHHHVVTAEQTGGDWREQLGVVLSAGLRPCTGALLVLVFALSQGIFVAGVASAFLMGLGTAITVSLLAVVAVSAKGLARRYLDANGRLGSRLVSAAELFGALVVLAFGLAMLFASL
jgi:ABC-type nickel/cobalt efflux system permease component RcnA/ABC-type uncharacterized transport system substrate-binding protein